MKKYFNFLIQLEDTTTVNNKGYFLQLEDTTTVNNKGYFLQLEDTTTVNNKGYSFLKNFSVSKTRSLESGILYIFGIISLIGFNIYTIYFDN